LDLRRQIFVLFVAACGGAKNPVEGETHDVDSATSLESMSGSSTSHGTLSSTSATGESPLDTSTGTGSTTVSDSAASSGGCVSGEPCMDLPDSNEDCDTWNQDCPGGMKCMPYSGDGDTTVESLKCVPVMENPGQAGDPCTAEASGSTGIDSCGVGLICWDVSPDTLLGTCVAFCVGSLDEPQCKDPGSTCERLGEVLFLCVDKCDPILQTCGAGELCVPHSLDGEGFVCWPDVSGDEGQEFDPCDFDGSCDPGFFCLDPGSATECDPMFYGCCIAVCDTSMPACSGQDAACVPWFEEGMAPREYEHVGVCVTPP
jgi:hypothetical protein